MPRFEALARLQAEVADKNRELIIAGVHVDATVSAEELRELKESTPECGDHVWAADPSARVALALNKNQLVQLAIIDKKGNVTYRGDFPDSYNMLVDMVDRQLKTG